MVKELRLRAMRNPQSLTKAEWNQLCEEAFSVPPKTSEEDTKAKQKKWW